MKSLENINYAVTGVVMIFLLIMTGCSTGYQLRQKDGAETLYHIDESGTRQIVYVLDKDGSLQIHNENDPLIQRVYVQGREGAVLPSVDDEKRHMRMLDGRLVRMGRLLVAEKRHEADPIFVSIRKAASGPTEDAAQDRKRYRNWVMAELTRDSVITITPGLADVDIFFKSYVRKTTAVNIKTQKLVTVPAFYYEALLRSNFLPGESHTICELGHLMDRRTIIKRAAQRVNKVIREKFGPNIPKDRAKYLPSSS